MGEGYYGQAANEHERGFGKELFCLDFGESPEVLERLARLDADDGHLGVGGVDTDYGSPADGGALIAGVVEDSFGTCLHFAQMLDGGWIGDTVPYGLAVTHKIAERVDVWLGFEKEVGHVGDR